MKETTLNSLMDQTINTLLKENFSSPTELNTAVIRLAVMQGVELGLRQTQRTLSGTPLKFYVLPIVGEKVTTRKYIKRGDIMIPFATQGTVITCNENKIVVQFRVRNYDRYATYKIAWTKKMYPTNLAKSFWDDVSGK